MVASVASLATASLHAALKIANQNKDGAFSWVAPLCATESSPDIFRRFLSLTKLISHVCDCELSLSFAKNPAGGIIKPAGSFPARGEERRGPLEYSGRPVHVSLTLLPIPIRLGLGQILSPHIGI